MAEEVGYLAWGEGFYTAVGLFYAVHQIGCEGMAEAMQSLLLYACELLHSVTPLDFFNPSLDMHHSVLKVDVAIEKPQYLSCSKSRIEHKYVGGSLLIHPLTCPPGSETFFFEFRNLLVIEHRNGVGGGEIFFSLQGVKVTFLIILTLRIGSLSRISCSIR